MEKEDIRTKDDYIAYLEQCIAELEEELARVKGERDKLATRLATHTSAENLTGDSLLAPGLERDFYPSERKEILVDVLKSAQRNLAKDSRRACIIDDILKSNQTEEMPDQKKRELQRIMKGYTVLDSALRRKLEKLGIDVEQTRKHYKLRYYGDSRFTSTLATSASDSLRAGNNIASDLARRFF